MNSSCSACAAVGRNSKLRPFQINLEEAVMMCAYPKCLDNFKATPVIVKRKAIRTYLKLNRKKPKPAQDQSSSIDFSDLDRLLNLNPSELPDMDFQDLFDFGDNSSCSKPPKDVSESDLERLISTNDPPTNSDLNFFSNFSETNSTKSTNFHVQSPSDVLNVLQTVKQVSNNPESLPLVITSPPSLIIPKTNNSPTLLGQFKKSVETKIKLFPSTAISTQLPKQVSTNLMPQTKSSDTKTVKKAPLPLSSFTVPAFKPSLFLVKPAKPILNSSDSAVRLVEGNTNSNEQLGSANGSPIPQRLYTPSYTQQIKPQDSYSVSPNPTSVSSNPSMPSCTIQQTKPQNGFSLSPAVVSNSPSMPSFTHQTNGYSVSAKLAPLSKNPIIEHKKSTPHHQPNVPKLCPTPISGTELRYPLWTNHNASCWLDSLLCLIVNNHSIRHAPNSCLKRLLDTYDYCWRLSNVKSQTDHLPGLMVSIRDEVYMFLQPAMKGLMGREDSPWFALLALLSLDSNMRDLFYYDGVWEGSCGSCGFVRTERKRKNPLSFPFVPKAFAFPDNVTMETTCPGCLIPGLQLCLRVTTWPNVLAVQFCNGLQHNHIPVYDFISELGQNFRVTSLIQYDQRKKHFVTWIRNVDGDTWLCCDDLKSSGMSKFQRTAPTLPVTEIHIMFWEAAPPPHPFQWTHVALSTLTTPGLTLSLSGLSNSKTKLSRVGNVHSATVSSGSDDKSNASDGDMNIVSRVNPGGYKPKVALDKRVKKNKNAASRGNGPQRKTPNADLKVVVHPKKAVKGLLDMANLFAQGF